MNRILVRIVITFLVILCQAYFPQITIFNTNFTPDILLVFLTIIAFSWGNVQVIFIGFIIGLCQDFSTQVDLLGMFAFAKSISGYGLLTLTGYSKIWSSIVRYSVLLGIYFIHFLIYMTYTI